MSSTRLSHEIETGHRPMGFRRGRLLTMPTGLSAIAVDLESAVGLALGLVDGGVGRGADDALSRMFGDCRADRVSVANIGLGMGQSLRGHDWSRRRARSNGIQPGRLRQTP